MRITCQSLNRPFKNQGVLIAIYSSILVSTSSRSSHESHTSLAAGIAGCLVLVAAVGALLYFCRRQRSAA